MGEPYGHAGLAYTGRRYRFCDSSNAYPPS